MERVGNKFPDDLSLAEFVRQEMHSFTQAERRISHVLLSSYPTSGFDTAANFAKNAGVSPPSILRFVSRLGFENYPSFQKHLREELAEQVRSPLLRTEMKTRKATEHSALKSAAFDMNTSIEATVSRIPPHEIESVTGSLSDPKKKISFLGGRLSSSLATIAFVQLRAVRKNIHLLQPQSDGLREEIVDFGARDVLIVYDIRRYSPEIFKFCEQVHRRGTSIILITDSWISPISRFAKHLLAVQTETHSTWDTLAGILLVTEALIANTTSNLWPTARERMNKFEELREAATLSESETPGQR